MPPAAEPVHVERAVGADRHAGFLAAIFVPESQRRAAAVQAGPKRPVRDDGAAGIRLVGHRRRERARAVLDQAELAAQRQQAVRLRRARRHVHEERADPLAEVFELVKLEVGVVVGLRKASGCRK